MPIPYLHFTDSCREAMTFYQDVLGGTLEMMGFEQMPGATEELLATNRVMHATLTTEQGLLYASDSPLEETQPPQAAVSISWDATNHAEGHVLFNRLLEGGGEAKKPYAETFYSTGFGLLRDRFGTHWMIMAPPPAA